MHHLVERRRDQAGQTDVVGLFPDGGVQDLLAGRHHAEVDDLVAVALQHHAHDVLADVVHVALDRRDHQAPAAGHAAALLFDIGDEMGHGLLHDPGRLDHLRQEHPAGGEQVAHDVHAIHQRALDHVQRPFAALPGGLGVLHHVGVQPVHQRIAQSLRQRQSAPLLLVAVLPRSLPLVFLRQLQQPLARARVAIEDHVLHRVAQPLGDVLVHAQLAGVDDPEVHAPGDSVIQEHRVHRLAHRIVAAERERQVADSAAGMHAGQPLAHPAGGLDESAAIVVVLLDTRGDGENVQVEDDVFRRKTGLFHEQPETALGDRDPLIDALGLALLVESHDDHGRAQAPDLARLLEEFLLAVLETDGIGHALALQALQAGDQHLETRRVDHDGRPRDVGLGSQQVDVAAHRGLGIEQPFVHVHVQQVGAGLDLLARHLHRGGVVVRLDEPPEDRRTGNVGALPHVNEAGAVVDVQRLQPGQPGDRRRRGRGARADTGQRLAHRPDVLRRRAAAAAGQIQQPLPRHRFQRGRHLLRRLGVFAQFVGQTGVGVDAHGQFGDPRQFAHVRMQLGRAQRAVQADGGHGRMPDGVVEGFHGLARQRPARSVGNRAGNDYGQGAPQTVAGAHDSVQRRLGIERVENGLDQQQVGAALHQRARGDLVGGREPVEIGGPVAGILHARRQRGSAVGGAQAAGHEVRPAVAPLGRVRGLAGDLRRCAVDVGYPVLKPVVRLRWRIGGEAVGGQDVGPGLEIGVVDFTHEMRLGQAQQVVVALQRLGPVGKLPTPVLLLRKIQDLGKRAHRAVYENDSAADQFAQGLGPGRRTVHDCGPGALDPSASQMAAVNGARFIV